MKPVGEVELDPPLLLAGARVEPDRLEVEGARDLRVADGQREVLDLHAAEGYCGSRSGDREVTVKRGRNAPIPRG